MGNLLHVAGPWEIFFILRGNPAFRQAIVTNNPDFVLYFFPFWDDPPEKRRFHNVDTVFSLKGLIYNIGKFVNSQLTVTNRYDIYIATVRYRAK